MESNTYLISSIQIITEDKLVFINNQNQLQEISFYECRKNWADHFNEGDFITWDGKPAGKITVEKNRCVGERDWFAENPYYDFYSNPKIRFEIQPKKKILDIFFKYWRQRYHSEFHKVTESLHKVGLTTFDLG